MTSLADFTKFPGLPRELQLKVWDAAIPNYSIIEIVEPVEDEIEMGGGELFKYPTTTARAHTNPMIQSLMHTCHDARQSTLKLVVQFDTAGFNLHRPFFYNPGADMILVVNPYLLDYFVEPRIGNNNHNRVNLRHLAVKFDFANGLDLSKADSVARAVRLFKGLESISVITTTRCQQQPEVLAFMVRLAQWVDPGMGLDCVYEDDL